MITISKPQVEVEKAVKDLISTEEERCTIVHCRHRVLMEAYVRIWKSTYLVEENGRRCKLIKAFNISIMPDWTFFPGDNRDIRFTLLFEGLSKDCSKFYLKEEIPEPGGFYSDTVLRNTTDVYEVDIES